MGVHGYPWISWISMAFRGYPCLSMDIHGYPEPRPDQTRSKTFSRHEWASYRSYESLDSTIRKRDSRSKILDRSQPLIRFSIGSYGFLWVPGTTKILHVNLVLAWSSILSELWSSRWDRVHLYTIVCHLTRPQVRFIWFNDGLYGVKGRTLGWFMSSFLRWSKN